MSVTNRNRIVLCNRVNLLERQAAKVFEGVVDDPTLGRVEREELEEMLATIGNIIEEMKEKLVG